MAEHVPWWKTAVVYQIYPRSFCDSPFRDWPDGGKAHREKYPTQTFAESDGIGDLEGIRLHLDHLAWLGVDAIWLSPVFPSPMADFGYDVTDFCAIDPVFGTLADFDGLLADAHARGIRVILDWVPNHTSDRHPWFLESRSSRDDPKRDWYVWRDGAPAGGPPNNWVAAFSPTPTWTFDEPTGQWYLHEFLPEQPDLNWANPEVVDAMYDTLRFWLDRGVDGFRADVVHLIGKDPSLADDPAELIPIPHVVLNDRPETHHLLRGIRALLDGYEGDRMMVGEVVLLDPARVATYYGDRDELHLSFNFQPLLGPWDAASWSGHLASAADTLGPRDAWPTWVLSNHDNRRHRTRYDGSDARARAAAVLLLGLRGTPFLYQGEELGLEDAEVPPERVVDPDGRDGCRAPIPWAPGVGHGWPTADPWLPWPPDAEQRNVASELADPGSILYLYRRLLTTRKTSPALRQGDQRRLATPADVVGWERRCGADRRVVLVNFADTDATVELAAIGETVVEVASDGLGEGAPFAGHLAGSQALVLRPSGAPGAAD